MGDPVLVPLQLGNEADPLEVVVLEQNASRRDVVGPGEGADVGQAEIVEGVGEGFAHELRGEPATPIGQIEVVGDLGPPLRLGGIDIQPAPTDDPVLGRENDRPGREAVLGEAGRVLLEASSGRLATQ